MDAWHSCIQFRNYNVSNLEIRNEIFIVAWQLVTQGYNNTRLIAMMDA